MKIFTNYGPASSAIDPFPGACVRILPARRVPGRPAELDDGGGDDGQEQAPKPITTAAGRAVSPLGGASAAGTVASGSVGAALGGSAAARAQGWRVPRRWTLIQSEMEPSGLLRSPERVLQRSLRVQDAVPVQGSLPGAPASLAVVMMRLMTCLALISGHLERIRAATPATIGVAPGRSGPFGVAAAGQAAQQVLGRGCHADADALGGGIRRWPRRPGPARPL